MNHRKISIGIRDHPKKKKMKTMPSFDSVMQLFFLFFFFFSSGAPTDPLSLLANPSIAGAYLWKRYVQCDMVLSGKDRVATGPNMSHDNVKVPEDCLWTEIKVQLSPSRQENMSSFLSEEVQTNPTEDNLTPPNISMCHMVLTWADTRNRVKTGFQSDRLKLTALWRVRGTDKQVTCHTGHS